MPADAVSGAIYLIHRRLDNDTSWLGDFFPDDAGGFKQMVQDHYRAAFDFTGSRLVLMDDIFARHDWPRNRPTFRPVSAIAAHQLLAIRRRI